MTTGSLHLIFEVHQVSRTLKKKDQYGEIAGVLIQLHTSALTLTLHLLECGEHHAEKLYHD